jgi:hypothetical protein
MAKLKTSNLKYIYSTKYVDGGPEVMLQTLFITFKGKWE